MNDSAFDYRALHEENKPSAVSTVVALSESPYAPMRAVLWHVSRQQWIYAPSLVSGLLYDFGSGTGSTSIDRATAEQIARNSLRTELPTEDALEALCIEGVRMNWEWGPPRE